MDPEVLKFYRTELDGRFELLEGTSYPPVAIQYEDHVFSIYGQDIQVCNVSNFLSLGPVTPEQFVHVLDAINYVNSINSMDTKVTATFGGAEDTLLTIHGRVHVGEYDQTFEYHRQFRYSLITMLDSLIEVGNAALQAIQDPTHSSFHSPDPAAPPTSAPADAPPTGPASTDATPPAPEPQTESA